MLDTGDSDPVATRLHVDTVDTSMVGVEWWARDRERPSRSSAARPP